MENFIPYYETIKLGGHAVCALIGAYLGGIALFAVSRFADRGVAFAEAFAFSLFAASAVWVIPEYAGFRGGALLWSGAIILAGCFPVLAFVSRGGVKRSAILWTAFALSQAVLLGGIYYQMGK